MNRQLSAWYPHPALLLFSVFALSCALATPVRAERPPEQPGLTTLAHPLDDATLMTHRAARSPLTARVLLPASGTQPAVELQPRLDARDGVSETIALPAASGSAPAAVSVVLQFAAANAGKAVWVHSLDGGTINGTAGGRSLDLDATGALAFSFQAPAASARYQVSVRLDNVESLLVFSVYDPAKVKPRTVIRPSAATVGH